MTIGWMILATVLAQAPSVEPSPVEPSKEQAQRLLDEGLILYEHHDYAAALARFNQALAAFPSPKLWFNVGQTQRDLHHPVEALAAFEKFLATTNGPADAIADARRSVSELERTLGRLRLRDTDSGMEVTVDGKILGRTPFVDAVWVTPGNHVLVIGVGAMSASTIVTVAAGGTTTVRLPSMPAEATTVPALAAAPSQGQTAQVVPRPATEQTTETATATPRLRRGWWLGRTWTWVAAGTAVVSAAGALTFGILMQSKYDDLNHSCGGLSSTRQGCSASDLQSLDQLKDTANILWIAAGVSALTTGILFAVEDQSVVVGPMAGGSFGLAVRGRF